MREKDHLETRMAICRSAEVSRLRPASSAY